MVATRFALDVLVWKPHMDETNERTFPLAHYLLQCSYTTDAWAAMLKNPQNRSAAVQVAIQNLGGKMDNFWLAFGDHDIVGILEMPDNVGASAFAMALAGGGAIKSVKTTPLMSLAEAVEAMKKAAKCGYKPVSAKRK